jgi:DNA-binding transcriptional ArsR family regulator
MEFYKIQAQLYKVLMHPTRLAILNELRNGEQCVCHMEAVFGLRQAHISQHLMVLRDAGLVTDRRDGWNIFYRVIRPEIYQVMDAASAFSGVSSNQPFSAAKKGEHSCPCPKCNTGTSSARSETPVLEIVESGK